MASQSQIPARIFSMDDITSYLVLRLAPLRRAIAEVVVERSDYWEHGDDDYDDCYMEGECGMMQKDNDVSIGRVRSSRLLQLSRKNCNDPERDESTEEPLEATRKQYICFRHGTLSLAMAMPEHPGCFKSFFQPVHETTDI